MSPVVITETLTYAFAEAALALGGGLPTDNSPNPPIAGLAAAQTDSQTPSVCAGQRVGKWPSLALRIFERPIGKTIGKLWVI